MTRPALWTGASVQPRIFTDTDGAWGDAVAVNDAGTSAVFLNDGRNAAGYRWHPDGEMEQLAKPPDGSSFWPVGIAQDSTVFGMFIDKRYGRRPLAVPPDGKYRYIDLPAGFELTAVSANGDFGGHRSLSGVTVPWLLVRGGPEPLSLPRLRHHHHNIAGMDGVARIVASATGDNCSHPLLWVRRREA